MSTYTDGHTRQTEGKGQRRESAVNRERHTNTRESFRNSTLFCTLIRTYVIRVINVWFHFESVAFSETIYLMVSQIWTVQPRLPGDLFANAK